MAKKAKKMSEATKRMLRERKAAARASTGSAKKGKKKPSKALAKGASSVVGHAAHGYTIKKVAKGASDAVRLSALEHNQGVIVHGLTAVAEEVRLHRAALVGAGLLSMRGKAGR